MARDIKIFNAEMTDDSGGLVMSIGIGDLPRSISGIELLAHKWLVIFLSELESSPIDPNSGGGILQEIGMNTDIKTLTDFRAIAQLALDKTNGELFMSQIEDDIDDEQERLASSSLVGVEKEGEDGFSVTVQIVNDSGIGASLIVPLV